MGFRYMIPVNMRANKRQQIEIRGTTIQKGIFYIFEQCESLDICGKQ